MADTTNEPPHQLQEPSDIKGQSADENELIEWNSILPVTAKAFPANTTHSESGGEGSASCGDFPSSTNDSREPSSGIQPPPLDADILHELEYLADGGDIVRELAEMFMADAAVQISKLERALAEGDGKTLGQVAHSLKGSSANLGATELARLCSMLSASADPPDTFTSEAVLASIHSEFERVCSAFKSRDTSSINTPTCAGVAGEQLPGALQGGGDDSVGGLVGPPPSAESGALGGEARALGG